MDKEKEIEEMAKVLSTTVVYDGGYGWDDEQEVDYAETARNLINAGYGNVKQAVKEFADNIVNLLEEMGMERSSEYNDGYDDGVADCITNIKSRFKELYGEEKE